MSSVSPSRKPSRKSAASKGKSVQGHAAQKIRAIRKLLGIDDVKAAQLLGYTVTTVEAWRKGEKNPGVVAQKQIDALHEVCRALSEILIPAKIPDWIVQPNKGFWGNSPMQFLEKKKYEPLLRMVIMIAEGIPL